jgi:hypothetical protein
MGAVGFAALVANGVSFHARDHAERATPS